MDIHRAMFSEVRPLAGKVSTTVRSIGVEPGLISSHLAQLCFDVCSWCTDPTELTFIEQSAMIHHKLVWVHPFVDGNGRWARFVADMYLRSWDCPFPMWPSELLDVQDEQRKKYIQALKSGDAGDYEPLINLIQSWGARDPSFADLLLSSFHQKQLTKDQFLALLEARIRRGHAVNQVSSKGYHPLQIAIRKLPESVSLLIDAGADLRYRDRSGLDSFEAAIAFASANPVLSRT